MLCKDCVQVKYRLFLTQGRVTKLTDLLDRAELVATVGLEKCERPIQKDVYLFTFREPNTTAVQVSNRFNISASTAQNVLNELAVLGLIFKDTSQKRNIEYYNYDALDLLN